MLRDVDPGEYIIVACTDEPVEMPFYMRFWSKEHFELVDTRGGKDWKVSNGAVDQIDRADRPVAGSDNDGKEVETASAYGLPEERDLTAVSKQVLLAGSLLVSVTVCVQCSLNVGVCIHLCHCPSHCPSVCRCLQTRVLVPRISVLCFAPGLALPPPFVFSHNQ